MSRGRVLRIVLLAASVLSFLFALFVWFNIDSDLSSAYFYGESLDFARYVWVEINLMLIALAVAVTALAVGLRQR